MPRVRLLNQTDEDAQAIEFEVTGEWPGYDSVLEAHGYDPATTDYEVADPDASLSRAIETASNLEELKAALTSDEHPAQARGRGLR